MYRRRHRWTVCMCITTLVGAFALRASAGLFSAWNYYSDLTFSGYTGAETLTNFPVLVSITNFSGFAYSQVSNAVGGDLRFTEASGNTELNYEVESWNTNGASYVWVQVPSLATNVSIRAYWGQAADAAPAYTTNGATWSNGYVAVWHFAETSGTTLSDSAGNYPGVAQGGVDLSEAGRIGSGGRFDGSDDCVALTGMSKIAAQAQLTVSGWARLDALGSGDADDSAIFTTSSSSDPILFWYNYTAVTTGDKAYTFNVGETSSGANRANTGSGIAAALVWQHVVGVMSNTSRRIYVDGTQRATSTGVAAATGATTAGFLGKWSNSANFSFDGAMDEVRISTLARSADWVKAEYDTVARAAFASYGGATPSNTSRPQILSDAARNVSDFSADAVANLSLLGDSSPTVYLAWGADPAALGTTNNLGVFSSTGEIITPLSNLNCVSTYYYRHFAVNSAGMTESSSTASFTTTGRPVFGSPSASNLVRSAFFSVDLTDCGVADATVSLWTGASPDSLALSRTWSPVSAPAVFSGELAGQTLGATLYYGFKGENSFSGQVYTAWTVTNAFTLAGSTAWNAGGGVDTDWNTEANWSLGVPGAAAQADFLSAAKKATVTAAATTLAVGTVSVQTGGALTFDLGSDTTLGATTMFVGTNTASALTLASGALAVGNGGLAAGLGSSITLNSGSRVSTGSLRLSGTSTKVLVSGGASLASSGMATFGGASSGITVQTGGVWNATNITLSSGPAAVVIDGGVATNTGSLYLGNNASGSYGDTLLVQNGGRFRQVGSAVQVAVKQSAVIMAAAGGTFEAASNISLGTGSDWGSPGYLIASNGNISVGGTVYVCADARYHTQHFFVYEDEGLTTSVNVAGSVVLGRGSAAAGDPGNRNNVFGVFGGDVAIGSSLIIGGTKAAATNNALKVKGASTHLTAASLAVTNQSRLVFSVDNSGFATVPVSISGNVNIDGTTQLEIDAAARTQKGVVTLVESTGGAFVSSIPSGNITVTGRGGYRVEVLQTGGLALKFTVLGTLLRVL